MNENDVKKLKRHDLLVLLAEQTKRADALEEKVKSLEIELDAKKIKIDSCGTLAEASLKLANIFESADQAANMYLENIKEMYNQQLITNSEMEETCRKKCEELVSSANEYAKKQKEDADIYAFNEKMKAEKLLINAKEEVEKAKEKARNEMSKIDVKWEEFYNLYMSWKERHSNNEG